MNGKSPLPPEEKDTVIDVSLKHILIAFGGLVSAIFTRNPGRIVDSIYVRSKSQQISLKISW